MANCRESRWANPQVGTCQLRAGLGRHCGRAPGALMANPADPQGVRGSAWAALALLTGLTATAHAQEQGLPLWELGVFAGGLSSPAYPASTERSTRALVLPTFIYRGEVFRSDRGGVGARLLRTEDTELDLGFAASLPASSDR